MILLYLEGYQRGRAWSAFYAGYGVHTKDASIDDLLGRTQPEPEPMDADQMLANLRAHVVAVNAVRKVQGLDGPTDDERANDGE